MLLGVSVEETWNSLCGSFLNLHIFNPEQLAMLLPNNFSNLLKCSKGSLTPNLWSKDMSSTCESLNRKLWCNRNTWRKMAVDCWLQGGVGFTKPLHAAPQVAKLGPSWDCWGLEVFEAHQAKLGPSSYVWCWCYSELPSSSEVSAWQAVCLAYSPFAEFLTGVQAFCWGSCWFVHCNSTSCAWLVFRIPTAKPLVTLMCPNQLSMGQYPKIPQVIIAIVLVDTPCESPQGDLYIYIYIVSLSCPFLQLW